MVGQRQSALPAGGRIRTGQDLQNLLRRPVADRQGGDRGEILVAFQAGLLLPFIPVRAAQGALELVEGKPLRSLERGPERRGWIARPVREELDAPALDGRLGPVTAFGIGIPLREAVIGGVGVDQDSDGALRFWAL